MKINSSSFLLSDFLTIAFTMGIFGSIIVALVGCMSPAEVKANAEENLEAYIQALNNGSRPATCVSVDSDGNGKVACTLVRPDKTTQSLECGIRPGYGCQEDMRVKHSVPIN